MDFTELLDCLSKECGMDRLEPDDSHMVHLGAGDSPLTIVGDPETRTVVLLSELGELPERGCEAFYKQALKANWLFQGGGVRGIKDWPELGLFGRPPLEQFRVNGRLGAVITTPLLWDVEKMAKYRIVPGEIMTPEERRAEMRKAKLKPLKGFRPLDAKLPGCTFEPTPDGTGFRFGQGTNGYVRVSRKVGAADGLLPPAK